MFLNSFGVSHGRQISEFPKYKDWKSTLKRYLNCGPREKKRIEVYLRKKREREKAFLKTNRLYKNSDSWIENANREQSNNPFHAVISSKNEFFCYDNFIPENEFSDIHELMESSVDVPICRTVSELTNHVEPLLDQSRSIIFVDPYFHGTKSKFLEPLGEFLNIIGNNPHGLKRGCIQYHHNDGGSIGYPNDVYDEEQIKVDWAEKINMLIPSGVEIQFHMWPFRVMHNRYILTDVYGVQYGQGLSKDNSGYSDEDEILGLGMVPWNARFDKYLNHAAEPYMICGNP